MGADDYVTKPFHKDELIARIHAIVHRTMGHAEPTLNCGDLTVKPEAKQAEIAGKTVPLTGKEYGMLELLAMRQGHTITKEMFLNQLYGGMDEPEQKIIDVFICKLRKKLAEASGGKNYIETVWGRGTRSVSRISRGSPDKPTASGITSPSKNQQECCARLQAHGVASRSHLRYSSDVDWMAQGSEAGFKKTLALCRVRMDCSGDVFEPRTHLER